MATISLLFVFVVILQSGNSCRPCAPRDYGKGSVVCVCNATYCDDVEPNDPQPKGQISQYLTTKAGKRLAKSQHAFSTDKKTDDVVFTINPSKTYQNIIGFGGAFTDSASMNILSLSKGAQDNLLRSYFSSDGAEYNLGRLPMASCDFSPRVYSYDDTLGDFDLKNFALQDEDLKYKIPVIQRAQELSKDSIRLFGSPWAAPGWMKTNGKMIEGGYLKGQPGGQYYKTWAKYFVRFIEEYKRHNISIWGLTAQNEPMEGRYPEHPWQSLGFTAELQRDFITLDLGPALHDAGFQDVQLMILDDQSVFLPGWPKTVLKTNGSVAGKYVSGIAFHFYLDSVVPAVTLDETHRALPSYFILETEACTRKPVVLGGWEGMERYTHDIIRDLNHWVAGWTDWNMVLDMDGGPSWIGNELDAPVIVNGDEFYKQPMFYAMAHFSKFVKPDSHRIKVSASVATPLEYVAVQRQDGAIVFIISNPGDSDVSFSILDPNFGMANLEAPARSIQTLSWWY